MTEIEKKVVEYAKSVNWNFDKVVRDVQNSNKVISFDEWKQLKGKGSTIKVQLIFEKYMEANKTTVKVLDKDYTKKPVPIELKFVPSVVGCTGYSEMSDAAKKHSFWDNIVLISTNYENGWDLILVYNDSYEPKSRVKLKQLCLGKWNDGVTESEDKN